MIPIYSTSVNFIFIILSSKYCTGQYSPWSYYPSFQYGLPSAYSSYSMPDQSQVYQPQMQYMPQETYQPQQPSILNLIDTIAHIVNSSMGKSSPSLQNMPIFGAKMSSPVMDDNKITPDLTSFKGDWNNMQPPEPQMTLPEMKQLPILENLDEVEGSKLESPYPGFLPNFNQNLEDRNFDPDKFFNEKISQKDYQGLANLINSLPNHPLLFRIGDLLNYGPKSNFKRDETVYDMKNIKGFPIIKDIAAFPSPRNISIDSDKGYDDNTLLGLISSGRWKTIDWKRKILGLDEIPTASEGNALAQLLETQS